MLEVTLHARGIRFRHSRPYHPQTCGKVERFHQTLKKWLAQQPPATTLTELQAQLDHYRVYYNTVRPHRALHRCTPEQAYLARPKATPTGSPLHDGHYRIRHDRIDSCGKLTLRHNSRLHHLGIGRRHAGTNVLVLIHDLHIRVLDTDGHLLRELQLNPTTDYQPQPKACTMSRDICARCPETSHSERDRQPNPHAQRALEEGRMTASEARLELIDAAELAETLGFISQWLTGTDHVQLTDSFRRFVGTDGYDLTALRTDLARFTFLLGHDEQLFGPLDLNAPPLPVATGSHAICRDRRWAPLDLPFSGGGHRSAIASEVAVQRRLAIDGSAPDPVDRRGLPLEALRGQLDGPHG